jgi:hypothetical protein
MPVQPREGTFRYATLLPLTRLNWRASNSEIAHRLIGAVKGLSEAALYSSNKTLSQSKQRFGTGIACTKTHHRHLACLV